MNYFSNNTNTCMELALEGERLCKSGDFEAGVNFFEAAINIGTNDIQILSAIYSQLGNAYFYLNNYEKAFHFHKLDFHLSKSMGDRMGEAKASGNLGNALKMIGKFEESAEYCNKHLEIAISLNDKIGEGRALYNLGNVYHTKGKHLAELCQQDPGDLPEDAKRCLRKAVEYYEKNLELMVKLGDKQAEGRVYGNLGNTHYLLGNFKQAIMYHSERLRIAKEFSDKSAERKAHCNLGNAHIFLGEFEKAVDNYKETLKIAQEIKDKNLEAQAYYSLGNTFTLLRDFKTAIEYHLKHLQIAQELKDSVGEGRAYWSLGNALTAIGNHHEALNCASKHLDISTRINDKIGQRTATKSISDLQNLMAPDDENLLLVKNKCQKENISDNRRKKRASMENMDIIKLTPTLSEEESVSKINHVDDDDYFIDLLMKTQSQRMDDQRCPLETLAKKSKIKSHSMKTPRLKKI